MPRITGWYLYVEGKPTAVSASQEGARRLAAPYIRKRQALELESCIASLPSQAWAYDYDIAAWVLRRYLANDKLTTDRIPAATDRGTS